MTQNCPPKERKRLLLPEEMLTSLALPVRPHFSAVAGAPAVPIGDVSLPQQARMAGNAMSLPALGAVMLAAACFVEFAA